MYQNDPNKVLTGEVRLSYAHLTTPQAPAGGGDPVYSCTLLIPKTDTATFQDICAAIDATRQAGAPKWGCLLYTSMLRGMACPNGGRSLTWMIFLCIVSLL